MSDDWFVRVNSAEHGPLSSDRLRQLVEQGKIGPETFVKQGASGTWFRASHVKGLLPAIPPAPDASQVSIPNRPPMAQPGHAQPAESVKAGVPQSTTRAEQPGAIQPGVFAMILSAMRGVDRFFVKMVGGADNIILARFLQVFVVALPIGVLVVAHEIKEANRRAEQERIAAANQDVKQAVDKAKRWVQVGKLADADEIEKQLNAAQANTVATEKDSVVPTLMAFDIARAKRQAGQLLESAVDAIALKRFDQAHDLLRKYVLKEHATEKQKAEKLLAEIAMATSDTDALQTLLVMDDDSFASFSKGKPPTIELSHPALVEARIASLKKNLAEATRQREDRQKRDDAVREVARIADQKRVVAAKEAIRRSDERRRRAKEKEEAEARDREVAAMRNAAREKTRQAESSNKEDAWLAAEIIVKERLKSPSTATFGWQTSESCVTSLGNNRYRVNAWVDGQNAFGATCRTDFSMDLQPDGAGGWSASNITMNQR